MTPELPHPIRLDQVTRAGLRLTIEADAAQRAALAVRMGIPAIAALRCKFRLRREGESVVTAEGTLTARVTQTCVVSLEDFETTVAETFRVRFVPSGEEREDVDPDDDDEIPYEDGVFDLGEAAAEQLGLALDPYPRMPDAALPEIEPDDEPHPFAALGAFRKPG